MALYNIMCVQGKPSLPWVQTGREDFVYRNIGSIDLRNSVATALHVDTDRMRET